MKLMSLLFVCVALLSTMAQGQFDDVEFKEKALDFAKVALQPYLHHTCTGNSWNIDINTPEEWGAVGDVDIFSHVGQHWGCLQAKKEAGLAGEAKTTHIVSYAGSFTPPTMFVFAIGSKLDGNKAVTGASWEKLDFDIGTGFIGGTVKSIVEFKADGSIEREVEFADPVKTLFFNWFSTGEKKVGDHLRMTTFTAKPNNTFIDPDLSGLIGAAALGVETNFEFDLTVITSTDYGELELDPPVPISSLGVEWIVQIRGWGYKSEGNTLGIRVGTIQSKGTIEKTESVHRIVTEDEDFYNAGYWNFPNVYQACQLSKKRGEKEACESGDLVVDIQESSNLDTLGNLVMKAKAAVFFNPVSTKATVADVLLRTTKANSNKVIIDPGFGVGPYPYTNPPTCSDDQQNGDETGIDCGGSCEACPQGCHPVGGTASKGCESCFDGIKNGDEEDIDCGGGCVQLGDDKKCGNCVDGLKNGDEEGIDCGGRCALPAPHGINKFCPDQPSCNNMKKDGAETGIDCGGPVCKKCEAATQQVKDSASTVAMSAVLMACACLAAFL